MLALSLFKTSKVFELQPTRRHAAIIDLHAYVSLIDLPSSWAQKASDEMYLGTLEVLKYRAEI